MATWKKVITEDDVANLATANLTMSGSRTFSLTGGYSLGFQNAAQNNKLMFGLHASSSVSLCRFYADIVSFSSTWGITMEAPSLYMTDITDNSYASPTVTLMKKKGGPTVENIVAGDNNDSLGGVLFKGYASGPTAKTFASINTKIEVALEANSSGSLAIGVLNQGTLATALELLPRGVGQGLLTELEAVKVHGSTLSSLVTTLAAADNASALAVIQADVDANEVASDANELSLALSISTVQADVDANELASDAAEAALQLLITNLTSTVTALNTYATNLQYNFSTDFKLLANSSPLTTSPSTYQNYGLASGAGMIFRREVGGWSETDRHDGYQVTTTEVTAIISPNASAVIPGVYGVPGGDMSIYNMDQDIESGRAGAWLTYERGSNSPGVTIRFHGSIWMKSREVGFTGQTIQTFSAHRAELKATTSINVATGMPFNAEPVSTHSLTEAYNSAGPYTTPYLNKFAYDYTYTFSALGDNEAQVEMFMIGVANTSVDPLGSNDNSNTYIGYDSLVADLQMIVKPT